MRAMVAPARQEGKGEAGANGRSQSRHGGVCQRYDPRPTWAARNGFLVPQRGVCVMNVGEAPRDHPQRISAIRDLAGTCLGTFGFRPVLRLRKGCGTIVQWAWLVAWQERGSTAWVLSYLPAGLLTWRGPWKTSPSLTDVFPLPGEAPRVDTSEAFGPSRSLRVPSRIPTPTPTRPIWPGPCSLRCRGIRARICTRSVSSRNIRHLPRVPWSLCRDDGIQ